MRNLHLQKFDLQSMVQNTFLMFVRNYEMKQTNKEKELQRIKDSLP
jgi:hypothetical protein